MTGEDAGGAQEMTARSGGPVPLAECALLLRPGDDVAVVTRPLPAGFRVLLADREVAVPYAVPRGHKVAVRDVATGSAVRKYGQVIGRATADIAAGEHVHTHNLGMDDGERVHELATVHVDLPAPTGPPRTFDGYHRADGRVGTRNFVGILTSVNCSASAAWMIAHQFRGPALDAFPLVDGVVALTHQGGCGLVGQGHDAVDVREHVEDRAAALVG